ncbi:MAG: TIR domain-containing protein [Bacteroidota bacterium]
MPQQKPVQIFIAYSREDEAVLKHLLTHLKPLARNGRAQIWYDGLIETGELWDETIKSHLRESDIILMLLSSHFIHSDYVSKTELPLAMQRGHEGRARLIPVVARHCLWQELPLGDIQLLPKDGQPIVSQKWDAPDEPYLQVALEVRKAIETVREARVKAARAAEKERLEREKAEREQILAAKRARDKAIAEEADRKRKEAAERAQKEADAILEARKTKEAALVEAAEKKRKEKAEREKAESERILKEKKAREVAAMEEAERKRKEKAEKEQAEADRILKEKAAREAAAIAEVEKRRAEKAAKEKAEAERILREKEARRRAVEQARAENRQRQIRKLGLVLFNGLLGYLLLAFLFGFFPFFKSDPTKSAEDARSSTVVTDSNHDASSEDPKTAGEGWKVVLRKNGNRIALEGGDEETIGELKLINSEGTVVESWGSLGMGTETSISHIPGGDYRLKAKTKDNQELNFDVTIPDCRIAPMFIPASMKIGKEHFHVQFDLPGRIASYELKIYLTPRRPVFETRDFSERWNGEYNGNPVPPGTYTFEIKCTLTCTDLIFRDSGRFRVYD